MRRESEEMDSYGYHSGFESRIHRQHGSQCRSSRLAIQLSRDSGGRAMGGRSLRAFSWRFNPGWRFAGRLVRTPADFCRWRRDLCHCIDSLWPLFKHSPVGDREERSRDRRGAAHSGKPCNHQRVFRRKQPRTGDRNVVGLHGDHCRIRACAGRLDDRTPFLASGVLYQYSAGVGSHRDFERGKFQRAAARPRDGSTGSAPC